MLHEYGVKIIGGNVERLCDPSERAISRVIFIDEFIGIAGDSVDGERRRMLCWYYPR